MKKHFKEMATVEERRKALEVGHLAIDAATLYEKGDESWKEKFHELSTILHEWYEYSEIPYTIEDLCEFGKEAITEIELRKAEK